jgi:hypothetical protein
MQRGCSTSQLVDKLYASAKGLPEDWRIGVADHRPKLALSLGEDDNLRLRVTFSRPFGTESWTGGFSRRHWRPLALA